MSAQVIQVIVTENARGEGVAGDPIRLVREFWSLDGRLLAEVDPHMDGGRFAHPTIPGAPK